MRSLEHWAVAMAESRCSSHQEFASVPLLASLCSVLALFPCSLTHMEEKTAPSTPYLTWSIMPTTAIVSCCFIYLPDSWSLAPFELLLFCYFPSQIS